MLMWVLQLAYNVGMGVIADLYSTSFEVDMGFCVGVYVDMGIIAGR